MATIRKWLDGVGFNWDQGNIVYQAVDGNYPGWSYGSAHVGQRIEQDNPILDQDFDDGYGAPYCPRFVARDDQAIYFPVQYDGSTWIEHVVTDLSWYLEEGHETPYPGG